MTSKRSGLGKGLGALIPTHSPISPETNPQEGTSSVREVAVNKILPNPRQPRTQFDVEELQELSNSIKEYGIIQPLIVTHGEDANTYTLIAGERRLQAARLANLEYVPVILREASQQELLELALIENVQRADLSPLETAEAYRQLSEDFHLTHEEIAWRVGKSRVAITNTMGLLRLSSDVQKALAERKISEGHARPLLRLSNEQAQKIALHTIISKELNVRETEELVNQLSGQSQPPPTEKKQKEAQPIQPPEIVDLQNRLRSYLGQKVELARTHSGGHITIHFFSDEELNAVIDLILGQNS